MTASRRRQEQHWNSVSAHTENHVVSQHTNNHNSPPNIKHHPPRHTTAQPAVAQTRDLPAATQNQLPQSPCAC